MNLTSPAFENGDTIPPRYTCDGENTNPELNILDVPVTAKSLVLIMDDPDIPDEVKQRVGIQVWDHWIVFNIPPDTITIPENQNPPGVLGMNSSNKNEYAGPCPPPQLKPTTHRYIFKLYALDTTLNLSIGSTKAQVEQAMESHIIKKCELVGKYDRS